MTRPIKHGGLLLGLLVFTLFTSCAGPYDPFGAKDNLEKAPAILPHIFQLLGKKQDQSGPKISFIPKQKRYHLTYPLMVKVYDPWGIAQDSEVEVYYNSYKVSNKWAQKSVIDKKTITIQFQHIKLNPLDNHEIKVTYRRDQEGPVFSQNYQKPYCPLNTRQEIESLSYFDGADHFYDSIVKLSTQGHINPFSMPALIAFVLSSFNFFTLLKRFKESLPPSKRGKSDSERTANIFKLFKPLPYSGVNLTNIGHFLFLLAFSGMEFTLTFLAVERLSYSSLDNAYMFIFIGFLIALIQGGYVRRKASSVGEKKIAMNGLISLIPGLLCIAYAESSWLLYLGLFFLAVGSAMAIPCLTSLVSLYSPSEEQGKSIGIFRSLGALARVVGPIIASIIYWRVGSAGPYLMGAAFLLIPIVMVSRLPRPNYST